MRKVLAFSSEGRHWVQLLRLRPDVVIFPNAQAVNDALRGLMELAKVTGLSPRPTRTSRKVVAG